MNNISKRLKELRKQQRLTQEELGKILSVSKQAIANIESEHNKPSIEFISKLIENLNVNSNWFISGIGEMFNKIEPSDDELTDKIKKVLREEGVIS